MDESLRRTSGLEPPGEDASRVRLSHATPPALAAWLELPVDGSWGGLLRALRVVETLKEVY